MNERASGHNGCGCGGASRRGFLGAGIGCGAYLGLALAGAPAGARRAFASAGAGAGGPDREVVSERPFARVERVAPGVWAAIATPWESRDFTAVANGGIIAGRDATLVVEGLNTDAGGAWLARLARRLTGRAPGHVVLTHFHGDHSNGLTACVAAAAGGTGPDDPGLARIYSTDATHDLLAGSRTDRPADYNDDTGRTEPGTLVTLPNVLIDPAKGSTTIDLGGRTVTIRELRGHTPSDIVVETTAGPDGRRVVFCGDLVFNGLFPFYGDAIPSVWTETCRDLLDDPDALYVPGHGSVADRTGLSDYVPLLEDVGEAAKRAIRRGMPAEQAWREYEVPESLGDWRKFRPDVFRFAFEAWEREMS